MQREPIKWTPRAKRLGMRGRQAGGAVVALVLVIGYGMAGASDVAMGWTP